MAKQKFWQSDEEFDMLLRQSLTAIQPPADFSSRVMAAIHEENQARQNQVVPFPTAKAEPARRWHFGPSFWPGLGTIAASLVLFAGLWAMSGSNEEPLARPFAPNLQTAQLEQSAQLPRPQIMPGVVTPEVTTPDNQEPTQEPTTPEVTEPTPEPRAAEPTPQPEATQPSVQPVEAMEPVITETEPEERGNGELILPLAAYGTDAQGTLSVRLLAEVPSSEIFSPSINGRGSAASFYTADDENVYSWRVSLQQANSPEVALVTSRSDIADVGAILAPAAARRTATELVASPDGTIMAQNSPDGIWISLAEGEVYNISDEEKGGSLLAWSPDSSKLLFTNAEGQLFMSYPLEKRIYQITDLAVKDVCWSPDNQTIIFLTTSNGQDALYIAELI